MEPLHDLKITATPHFTALKGTGAPAHNLETALHHATISSSSALHPIHSHIKNISTVFNEATVKKAVRAGGLSATAQKTVFRKILKQDAEIGKSEFKKKLVKQVISHFGKDKPGTNAHPVHKVIYAAPPVQSHSSGSASALTKHHDVGSTAQAQPTGLHPTTTHFGSASQLVQNTKPHSTPSSTPFIPLME